jgi:hypothetical protein
VKLRAAAALALCLLAPAPSWAARVGVPAIGGDDGGLRDAIVDALVGAGQEATKLDRLPRAADARLASLSRLGLDGAVLGRLRREGRTWRLSLSVIDAVDAVPGRRWKLRARSVSAIAKRVREQLVDKLGPDLARLGPTTVDATPDATLETARTPSRAEPTPVDPGRAESRPLPDPESTPGAEPRTTSAGATGAPPKAGRSAAARARPADRSEPDPLGFQASLRIGVTGRRLSWTDDLFGALRPYRLAGAPLARLDLVVHPLPWGLLRHLGVEASLGQALAVESIDAAGQAYGTRSRSLYGGLRGRVPLGDAHALALALGMGWDGFGVDHPEVPSVGYLYGRAGAALQLHLVEAFGLGLGAGYRLPLSLGELGEGGWFPRATAGGVDARAELSWGILGQAYLVVGGGWERWFLDLRPEPGDPRVAGGAVDERWSVFAGLGWGRP